MIVHTGHRREAEDYLYDRDPDEGTLLRGILHGILALYDLIAEIDADEDPTPVGDCDLEDTIARPYGHEALGAVPPLHYVPQPVDGGPGAA